MAKLDALPEQAIIDGFKGRLDYYYYMGIPCCRSWPSSPGPKRAPAVESQWPVFADASRLWNTLSPEVQQAYNAMASGSTLSGRDMMVKMYINARSILPY
jgi:hypothetical protein